MAVKYLTFSFFLSLILFFSQAYGKTIHGKPKIIDGDTIHIGKNKIRLHAIDAPSVRSYQGKLCLVAVHELSHGLKVYL